MTWQPTPEDKRGPCATCAHYWRVHLTVPHEPCDCCDEHGRDGWTAADLVDAVLAEEVDPETAQVIIVLAEQEKEPPRDS